MDGVVAWLLASDPSVRWQALRDLTDAPRARVAAERARVASEGWGAALLALQGEDGHFVVGGTRGWSTDLQALALLTELGLDPASDAARRAIGRVRDHVTWEVAGDRGFFDGETEPCINGAVVALGAYFGEPRGALVERLLGEQLADGGWNCDAPPSVRSSFHSTIRVLEGLLAYERRCGATPAIARSRARGEAYLLERRLLRSLRTGAIVDAAWLRFAFPTTWRYDALRALEYFRAAGLRDDARLAEALDAVEARRGADGRWPLDVAHAGALPFAMDLGVGEPSAWITLRARRVLAWFGRGA